MYPGSKTLGTFCVGRATAAAGTPFVQLLPPYPGSETAGRGNGLLQTTPAGAAVNWFLRGSTHVTRLAYLQGTTSHQLVLMRPKNWTTFTLATPKNRNIFGLMTDPGVYSTNYKYPAPRGSVPGEVADHALAAGDYFAWQYSDGTWGVDTAVTGLSGGVFQVTNGTPNQNGATINKGAPLFYFGTPTLKDPATGTLDPTWTTVAPASGTAHEIFTDSTSIFTTLHPGDPALFYSPNGTTAGELELISGFYE